MEDEKMEDSAVPASPAKKPSSPGSQTGDDSMDKPLNGNTEEEDDKSKSPLLNGDPDDEAEKVNGDASNGKEDEEENDSEEENDDEDDNDDKSSDKEQEESSETVDKDEEKEVKSNKEDEEKEKESSQDAEDDKEESAENADEKEEKFEASESTDAKDEKLESSEGTDAKEDKKEETPTKSKGKGGSKKTPTTPQQPTRSSSRIKRTAKYVEEDCDIIDDDVIEHVPSTSAPAPKRRKSHQNTTASLDDDDIEITGEVVKNSNTESDVEMIEESDPLAISDADVRKSREKKDHGVIIIDTHTLLRNQGNLQAAVAQSTQSNTTIRPLLAPQQSPVNLQSMQSAIHAITSNAAAAVAQQGLQNAYIAAIQQDDAYVIEAPSFIVPYVMEGKPKEPIKTFLTRINKDQEDWEKENKDKKEDKKNEEDGEEESDDSKDKDEENDSKNKVEKKDKKENEDKEVDEEKKDVKDDEDSKEDEDETKDQDKEDKKEAVKEESEKEEESEEKKVEDEVEKEAEKDEKKVEKEDDKKTKDDKEEIEENNKSEDEDKENKGMIGLNDPDLLEKEDLSHLGKWEHFYKSSLGKFFLDLGLSQAQQFIQSDLLRMQKKRLDKLQKSPTYSEMANVKLLERQLEQRKKQNAHLNVPLKTCKFCNFKTESELVMNRHLESPHMFNYTYKCNFCDFETRGPQVILYHMEMEHCVRGRLERAPAFFQCPMCPFEDNNKSKMTRHSFSCAKKFKPDKNCDLADWEPPAKIPKVNRGRPNALGGKYEPVKIQSLLPKGLAGMNLGQLPPSMVSSLVANASQLSAAGRGRGRPVGSYKTATQMMAAARSLGNSAAANLLYQSSRGTNLLHQVKGSPQQPSISITPLPRGGAAPQQSKQSKEQIGKPSFVICEICDGYIKDLEQLRNHMNLIHKVKIHPKMIYNRPPLNCQKCQHRFFTDQGLERHLLGTHGLVTSSMQEAANKGKDAGRCPICGKVFQWKLLNHVSRDHKMTLKPAHLSYKCTVCTATFNMYRLFENHVYSAHSVVSKAKGTDATSTKKVNGSESPLKINDEITIIPQPASKAGSKDLKLGQGAKSTPSMSKEITITKVANAPPGPASSKKRNGGGGVEIISLDDSPVKRESAKKRTRETATSKRARQSSPT